MRKVKLRVLLPAQGRSSPVMPIPISRACSPPGVKGNPQPIWGLLFPLHAQTHDPLHVARGPIPPVNTHTCTHTGPLSRSQLHLVPKAVWLVPLAEDQKEAPSRQ